MRNKVIDLFGGKPAILNEGKKYSDLLNDFIEPFENDFSEEMDMDDVMEFSIGAWNLGCMSLILPDEALLQMLAKNPLPEDERAILKKMIDQKKKKYSKYDRFIADYTLEEKAGGLILTVATQEKVAYLESMMDESVEFESNTNDFEEGYINRYAVILKPKQPLFDWINRIYPEEPVNEVDEANIYLVEETDEYFNDWLKKKFDRFFKTELEEWHTRRKDWPKKRTYKMFKEWFDVEVSTMIYDFEKTPIFKEE